MSYRRALFRNKERTDALLGLYVNDYNGLTDRRVYEMLVEEQIAPRRGRGDPPHACLDGMHF